VHYAGLSKTQSGSGYNDMPEHAPIAKITHPRLQAALFRKRLFALLDKGRSTPRHLGHGSGRIGQDHPRRLWYHFDDSNIATFFYYLRLAEKKAASRYKNPLPLFSIVYMRGGVSTLTRNFFEKLCSRLKPPFTSRKKGLNVELLQHARKTTLG
jgi:hypothetical protein